MAKAPKPSRRKSPLERAPSRMPGGIWGILLVLFLGLYLASFITPGLQTKVVEYSEFKQAIRAGEVKEVFIGTEYLQAVPREGEVRLLAQPVEDTTLIPLLDEKGIKYGARAGTSWIRELLMTWILPFVIILFLWQFFLGRMFRQGPPGLMTFGKSRAKLVADSKNKTTFADVAGCDEAKEELTEVVAFLKTPEKFSEIGGRIPKGVLLSGPPGTGKTLLARAVAGEASVPFFQISGSDFVEMFVGVGAARVRDLFKEGQKNSPCIIFIDELDAIAKSRGGGMFQGNDEREQTLNQILVEMDGFDNHSGVIIMAATNRPEVLDPAILRPGRFDRQIVVDRPDKKGREQILQVHARKVKMSPEVDLRTFAARTPGFSGADLANVVNEAALLAVRKGLKEVTNTCFEEAIDRVVAGLARKSRVLSDEVRLTIAVHEIGHAVVARFTPGTDPVHRISIIPRGSGALGFTLQLPQEERYLLSQTQLMGMIRVLLGGRAAEKTIFGEVTSGAQDDLRRASDIARRMIMEFGMGDALGLVSLVEGNQGSGNPFLRPEQSPVSGETMEKIDREVRRILDNEFDNALNIVRNHRTLVDGLTQALLEKETLESTDFERLIEERKLS